MPIRRIPFLPDYFYHIYNRGINHERIFFTSENYLYCIRLLKKNVSRFSINILAYCLMPNHFHFLIRPEHDNVSQFMKSVFTSYTLAINRQEERQGPLFQGRFRAILVDEDEYLAHLARYIHLKPVAAGLVSAPEAWNTPTTWT